MAILQVLCINFVPIVTTPVVLIPQVIVTLVRKVIRKYKLLMPYGQLVEHFYIQVTLCISNPANDCDITLWVGIATPLDQRFIHKLYA